DDLNLRLKDHGNNLATSQRKLLMIARAMNTRKRIVLFDEPFDHLDEESTAHIVKLINSLKKKRTIIMVSSKVPRDLLVDQEIALGDPGKSAVDPRGKAPFESPRSDRPVATTDQGRKVPL